MSRPEAPIFTKRVAWHRIVDQHRVNYNNFFQRRIFESLRTRHYDMSLVEDALLDAADVNLPHSGPPIDGVTGRYRRPDTERQLKATAEQYGDGDVYQMTRTLARAQRKLLAAEAAVTPDPTSCYNFMKGWFSFADKSSLKPPLETSDPTHKVTSQTDRAETLAELYAEVHSDPKTSPIEAQEQLQMEVNLVMETLRVEQLRHAREVDLIMDDMEERREVLPRTSDVSVTELRACLADMKTGKASDFLGLKVEHLKLLDEESLAACLPFFERCITKAALPAHWRTAVVTPVPKPKRDLSLRRSWRPVSVTAIMCRLCETIVHNRIQHHFEKVGERKGKSQFGFRRGVSTAMPLTGLSMFINDGFCQKSTAQYWNARDPAHASGQENIRADKEKGGTSRRHSTLLVCVDASDAFCRAIPGKIVGRLRTMGLLTEARWVGELLTGRQLAVREGGARSASFNVARGVPQGSILGPLLWSLIIDDLLALCEAACASPTAGCVSASVTFADDINFAIRGFNPTSMVAQANILMRIVNEWSKVNEIPMAKLQATWIYGDDKHMAGTAANWTAKHGEIVLSDKVRCVPGTEPIRILGVVFDSDFKFRTHVDNVFTTGSKYLRLLVVMSRSVKAEKLAIVHRGLILSRILFAAEAWYPFISAADRARLQSLHYGACRAITGCRQTSGSTAVCFEASFRMLDSIVKEELVTIGDKMRRVRPVIRQPGEQLSGPDWVIALFRDEPQPTAPPRPYIAASTNQPVATTRTWPPPLFKRSDNRESHFGSLRDIGLTLHHREGAAGQTADTRRFDKSLRPMPRVRPWQPAELKRFDKYVRIITSIPVDPEAPGVTLVKPENFETLTAEAKAPFARATAARIAALAAANRDALFLYTDAARRERGYRRREACAGAYVIYAGADTSVDAELATGTVKASPIACIYTGELLTIEAVLRLVVNDEQFRRFKRVVLVTDSKSSLESVNTTWLRRIGHLEQDVCRLLFTLAEREVHITLAFVFSHTGASPGNERADKLATKAMNKMGHCWADGVWNVDSTRRIHRNMHDEEHDDIDNDIRAGKGSAFRFAHATRTGRGMYEPSAPLPRTMTRASEMLLYRARVGTMPHLGGFLHDVWDDCPLCEEPELSRGGKTIEHLLECFAHHVTPPKRMDAAEMWTDPVSAAEHLWMIVNAAGATNGGRRRLTELRDTAARHHNRATRQEHS